MYQIINGWTKEKMKAQIKKYNNNTRALNDSNGCSYLTEDDNRCAVGCFIPDGHPALTSQMVAHDGFFTNYPALTALMPLAPPDLLKFQWAHDGYEEFDSNTLHDVLFAFIDNKCTE